MAKAAKAALDEYSNDGDVSAVIIDLNDSPNVVMETPPGKSLSENDLDTYFENLKKTKFDGSGTDIISAFELVEAYRSRYSSPSRYAVLCFTDGLIESPHHKVFKTWSGFDWKKLYSDHAEVAFYFVDDEVKQRMVSGRMETAWQQITETMPEQEFPTWKVELASTVIDSLKEGDPYIPASDEGN